MIRIPHHSRQSQTTILFLVIKEFGELGSVLLICQVGAQSQIAVCQVTIAGGSNNVQTY